MADNYLEKQYEQYAARKAAWEKACKMGRKKSLSKSSITQKGNTINRNVEKSGKCELLDDK